MFVLKSRNSENVPQKVKAMASNPFKVILNLRDITQFNCECVLECM